MNQVQELELYMFTLEMLDSASIEGTKHKSGVEIVEQNKHKARMIIKKFKEIK